MKSIRTVLVIAILFGVTIFAHPLSANAGDIVKIFSGEKRLLLVNGYSTSFQWWAFLQRKIDRYLEYNGGPGDRIVEVQSVTKGGTPICRWMNVDTGERSQAWKKMITPMIQREQEKRKVIVLAQQSLQWCYEGERSVGIRSKNDRERIERGADILAKYANTLLQDGAAAVIIATHIYKKGMEPQIGNERFALADLMKRNPAHIYAGPDVWEPTSKRHPLAFDVDQRHPNYIGAEIMAHYWFAALLRREGLKVPDWSAQEMDNAIKKKPMGLTRDRKLFQQKLKEWHIVDRRPELPSKRERGRIKPKTRN